MREPGAVDLNDPARVLADMIHVAVLLRREGSSASAMCVRETSAPPAS